MNRVGFVLRPNSKDIELLFYKIRSRLRVEGVEVYLGWNYYYFQIRRLGGIGVMG